MSAKISRSDQFMIAFEEFMLKEFVDEGKLRKWSLNLLTKNTRKNSHEYKLVLPCTYFAYTLDTEVTLADGTKEGPGPIYLPQEIPPMDELIQTLREYFKQFVYAQGEHILSEVKIGEQGNSFPMCYSHTTDENGNKTIDVLVIYYKKYQPYTIQPTREQSLEIQLMNTESRVVNAEEKYQMMLQVCMNERVHYNSIIQEQDIARNTLATKFAKLESVFQKMAMDIYAKGEPQDCPICLVPMTVENLNITYCGHYICSECNSKCTKCPLCREVY